MIDRARCVAAALALLLVASGCDDGGDEDYIALDQPVASEADKLAITEVANAVLAGKGPGHICNVLLGRDLVEEFYVTKPACRRLVAARAAETAVVEAVDVDGARGYRPSGAADPLGEQKVRDCVSGQFQVKDDEAFLADAKTYLRGGKPAEKLVAKAVAACRSG